MENQVRINRKIKQRPTRRKELINVKYEEKVPFEGQKRGEKSLNLKSAQGLRKP